MRTNDSSPGGRGIKVFIAPIVAASILANPLAGSASETFFSRHTTNLSKTKSGSLHVIPDSSVSLGGPKFIAWAASNNPALTQPELTLFALDRFGTTLSVRRFANGLGQECSASRIIKTHDGGYAMIGHCVFPYISYSSADIGSFVFKVDSALNGVWATTLNQDPEVATYFMANDIKELADHSLAIVSTISSPFSGQFHNYNIAVTHLQSNGTLLWSNNYAIADVKAEGMAIHESAAHDLYVAGSILPAGGLKQTIVMKLDGSGNRLWSFGYGVNGTTDGAGYAITAKTSATMTEEFYVTGYINAPSLARGKDIHVLAIDANGNLLSSHAHGSSKDDVARWLTTVPTTSGGDSLFLTGSTKGFSAGGDDDAFLLETAGPSSVQDFTVHGGTGADVGREIDVRDGKLYAVGESLHKWSFGNSAQKGFLLVDDVGPPAGRVRCGGDYTLATSSLSINTNVAKFKTYTLPMMMTSVPDFTDTTGSSSAVCGALPN